MNKWLKKNWKKDIMQLWFVFLRAVIEHAVLQLCVQIRVSTELQVAAEHCCSTPGLCFGWFASIWSLNFI